jgi:hypothetical protein
MERQFIGGAGRHFPHLFPVWSNHEDFRIVDVLIDGIVAFLGTTMVVCFEVRYG